MLHGHVKCITITLNLLNIVKHAIISITIVIINFMSETFRFSFSLGQCRQLVDRCL